MTSLFGPDNIRFYLENGHSSQFFIPNLIFLRTETHTDPEPEEMPVLETLCNIVCLSSTMGSHAIHLITKLHSNYTTSGEQKKEETLRNAE